MRHLPSPRHGSSAAASPSRPPRTGVLCGLLLPLALAVASPLRAQDPEAIRKIQEIARRVDEQMQEIDRLLLESSQKGQARPQQKEKLGRVQEQSQKVEQGIDELIEELNRMKGQGGGSSSSDQQQQPNDQQSQGQPKPGQQQGQSARRENQTPDFVQQPREGQPENQGQPQPGQQQPQPGQQKPGGEQPQPGQPQGGMPEQGAGENRVGNNQLEPALGPGQPGTGEGSWGELQPYLNSLKNRGSTPKVPEKYRKYWEAYLKHRDGAPTRR